MSHHRLPQFLIQVDVLTSRHDFLATENDVEGISNTRDIWIGNRPEPTHVRRIPNDCEDVRIAVLVRVTEVPAKCRFFFRPFGQD